MQRLQERGLVGPGPTDALLRHADGFREVAERACGGAPDHAVDLGSGVGIPGLALALAWPHTHWSLLEANQRKAAVAERLTRSLGLSGRVEVIPERAEVAARSADLRGRVDLVVSRLLGPPAVAAEYAAPLLRVGGHLLVSEPPADDPGRWPPAELEGLGLAEADLRTAVGARFAVLQQVGAAPDRLPRRPGSAAKRPLW